MRAFVLVEGGSVWNKTAVQRHFYIANLIRHKQVQHNLKNQKQKNKRKCSVKKKKSSSCSLLTEPAPVWRGGGGGPSLVAPGTDRRLWVCVAGPAEDGSQRVFTFK